MALVLRKTALTRCSRHHETPSLRYRVYSRCRQWVSTDEGSALCRKAGLYWSHPKKRAHLNSRAKHTIETSHTPEKLPTHRPERLHRAHHLLEHNAVTRRSPQRPRRRRRTATTPSRARRSPRSTRTKPTRCARPSPSCPTSSSRPSSSASRTTSLSSSKRHRRLCPASNSARPCAV